ncbi:acyl-CoA thioesterase [Flavobacteriaceae bacterium]|jgi:acyl-CoA thioester hydrolase|nr:acyl-CoA thioesterase [Bacteroidota bacterium]MDA9552472.1 acyl-CoA thioesterase [Flavobacteriaceae bacterium]MDC0956960.1 thioesterase family protein [Flavobacteriaceae bacterium]MDG1379101.1 thioesterase family protein [Flavobacteriaceae bacterium]MDG2350887.1 thioesterase family protein [Flavobacteriaceae bacterium]|tara:strand:+ start:295 stop:690 length:396 start_codon:yes stop_codon:yes gene_type:complete
MKYNEIQIRVRYGETDQMGVVYHGNYSNYFEVGRLEWLRSLNISYKKMESEGIMLPVVSLSIKYKRPVHYDDLITIQTELVRLPTASIEFSYKLMNQQREILATASTILAFVNKDLNRPIRCPQYILDALS